MKTLYLECKMGAAGDMLMAALYEVMDEAQRTDFLRTMEGLGLPGVEVVPVTAVSCGIRGTHMRVTVRGLEEHEQGRDHDHKHDHDHDHAHEHEHDHDHAHEHEHDHDHAHEHEHDHDHAHEHVHDHEHDHAHEHVHDHDHGHEHEHDHDHGHEHEHSRHHHATPGHIAEIIDALALPPEVRTKAREVYDAIAQAEAQAHGCPVSDVHYHEVGALDAVADVVGVCYAMHLLAPEVVTASPVHVGSGTVRCAHGVMPVPAPATAALLKGIPSYGGEIVGELCTPTGAALLKCFVRSFGPMPPMAADRVGYGMGTKDFPQQPNCVRAFLGESQEERGEIIELVCNIDDMTPEALAFACTRLLEEGALDVYTTPGTMKKGRPGHVLTVLCSPEQEEDLARQVLAQTTTNGLRVRRCGKYFLTPGGGQIQTQWGPVQVKTARGFGVSRVKPEYEDAAALARANGLSYPSVVVEVIRRTEG